MGAYDNDPRVFRLPDGTFAVADHPNEDILVFPQGNLWSACTNSGRLVVDQPADFDTVVHALIGDPR